MKRSGLYLVKRGCDDITSSFVPMRTNLISPFSLTCEKGEMVSVDSGSRFLFLTANTFLTGLPEERTVRLSSNDTTFSRLPKTTRETQC